VGEEDVKERRATRRKRIKRRGLVLLERSICKPTTALTSIKGRLSLLLLSYASLRLCLPRHLFASQLWKPSDVPSSPGPGNLVRAFFPGAKFAPQQPSLPVAASHFTPWSSRAQPAAAALVEIFHTSRPWTRPRSLLLPHHGHPFSSLVRTSSFLRTFRCPHIPSTRNKLSLLSRLTFAEISSSHSF
jgi:hypothetical protein